MGLCRLRIDRENVCSVLALSRLTLDPYFRALFSWLSRARVLVLKIVIAGSKQALVHVLGIHGLQLLLKRRLLLPCFKTLRYGDRAISSPYRFGNEDVTAASALVEAQLASYVILDGRRRDERR